LPATSFLYAQKQPKAKRGSNTVPINYLVSYQSHDLHSVMK